MGFIKDLFRKLQGAPPLDLTFVPTLAPVGEAAPSQPIVADQCYLELYVESARLAKARKFGTKFHGAVYSFVNLARAGEPNSQLAAVSKPDKLADLDQGSLNKVITVSKKLMGAVPWRGGTLSLEVGLFSIKQGNLLSPVLDYVTSVSSVAGFSFVGAVKPFLPLITQGMDLIAGQQQDSAIEVALDTDLTPTQTIMLAIIAAPRNQINPTKLTVDPNDRRLLLDGNEVQYGYCVLSIRPIKEKADYGEIPELREKLAAVDAAVRANKIQEARDAFTAFRLATIVSPDLISADAIKLVEKAKAKLDAAFGGGPISKATGTRGIGKLADLELYD